ncbi:MAG: carbohydrate-binding family 9-like protein [Bacteroidales bacterium]|nr:carbohydrate-binding family 9-like protein [Bacteroidales bacterium]
MAKSAQFLRCNALDALSMKECGEYIENNFQKLYVDTVNWPSVTAYQPICAVMGAYSDKYLYAHFVVRENGILAENCKNLSPVANDSCVEFFLKTPTSDEYWNFEFNCIGAVNASHRVTRPNAIRLTDEEIASIKRHSSCGTEPFGEKPGIHTWTLTIAIPLTLIGINSADKPSHISGNFYKCAGKATHPHYLSWAPIKSEKPNFHLPEFFAPIQLL